VERKILPILKPGEKILWLLSIYEKDSRGYPDNYLSSIVQPIAVKFNVSQEKSKYLLNIRAPLKDDAIKVNLPFGWYAQ
jgi:hypothetical protein